MVSAYIQVTINYKYKTTCDTGLKDKIKVQVHWYWVCFRCNLMQVISSIVFYLISVRTGTVGTFQ